MGKTSVKSVTYKDFENEYRFSAIFETPFFTLFWKLRELPNSTLIRESHTALSAAIIPGEDTENNMAAAIHQKNITTTIPPRKWWWP